MSSDMLVDVEPVRAELAPVEREARADAEALELVVLESQAQLDAAAEALLEIKARAAALDAKRKTITQPLYQAMTAVNDLFRPALHYLGQCETTLKRLIADFRLREAARTAALHAQAAEAVQEGDLIGASEALVQVATTAGLKGISTVQRWTWRVTALEQVPREYLVVDAQKLDKLCASAKPPQRPPLVPGIEYVEEARVIARKSARKA